MGAAEGRCCCGGNADAKVQVISADVNGPETHPSVSEIETMTVKMHLPQATKLSRQDDESPLSATRQDEQSAAAATLSPQMLRMARKKEKAARAEKAGDVSGNESTPKQGVAESAFDTVASTKSTNSLLTPVSAFDTLEYERMNKTEKTGAKTIVKEFIRDMVAGQNLRVVASNGELRTCFVALSRRLDKLTVTAGGRTGRQSREIPLVDVVDVGAERVAGNRPDELEVTLSAGEGLTFRLKDASARDQLAACLKMLSEQSHQRKRQGQ